MIEEIAKKMGETRAVEVLSDAILQREDDPGQTNPTITMPELDISTLLERATLDYSDLYGSHEAFEDMLKKEYKDAFMKVCSNYHFAVLDS